MAAPGTKQYFHFDPSSASAKDSSYDSQELSQLPFDDFVGDDDDDDFIAPPIQNKQLQSYASKRPVMNILYDSPEEDPETNDDYLLEPAPGLQPVNTGSFRPSQINSSKPISSKDYETDINMSDFDHLDFTEETNNKSKSRQLNTTWGVNSYRVLSSVPAPVRPKGNCRIDVLTQKQILTL